tara:strand:+ start:177 stop:1181 length:1005 start_codon:yes stop_codon:yes gene_type:complete
MLQYIVKNILKLINKNKYFEIQIIKKNKDINYLINNWLKKIPELNKYNFKRNTKNIDKIYSFYKEIIPVIFKNSKNVFLRNKLYELKFFVEKKDKKKIDLLISEINFEDSVFERSTNLKKKNKQKELRNYEKAYGAKLFNNKYKYLWKNCDREKSLVLYFNNKPNLLKNKKILHISPEKKLKDYLNLNKKKLYIKEYLTSNFEDLKSEEHDYSYNIENIKEKSSKFDLIICHRVMEHVFDDKKAFKELMRVLKKDGILNISFPETTSKKTTEWIFQDSTHNNHVRQYGYDFKTLLDKNKHKIKLENFLLKKNNSFLAKNKIIPMRIYNIQKLYN